MGLVGRLTQALGGSLTAALELRIIQGLISQQLNGGGTADGEAFPGEVFGPTTLPPGTGASTEIVVNQVDAERTIKVVYAVLDRLKGRGQFLLGGIGVRFVPQTKSLLGMNVFPMNCYVELPSIRNADVLALYKEIWNAVEQAGVRFTCHWGQLHGMTPRASGELLRRPGRGLERRSRAAARSDRAEGVCGADPRRGRPRLRIRDGAAGQSKPGGRRSPRRQDARRGGIKALLSS